MTEPTRRRRSIPLPRWNAVRRGTAGPAPHRPWVLPGEAGYDEAPDEDASRAPVRPRRWGNEGMFWFGSVVGGLLIAMWAVYVVVLFLGDGRFGVFGVLMFIGFCVVTGNAVRHWLYSVYRIVRHEDGTLELRTPRATVRTPPGRVARLRSATSSSGRSRPGYVLETMGADVRLSRLLVTSDLVRALRAHSPRMTLPDELSGSSQRGARRRRP